MIIIFKTTGRRDFTDFLDILAARIHGKNLCFCTTRQRRQGERKTYTFMDEETFRKDAECGNVLDVLDFAGTHYWYRWSQLINNPESENIVIDISDQKEIRRVQEYCEEKDIPICTILCVDTDSIGKPGQQGYGIDASLYDLVVFPSADEDYVKFSDELFARIYKLIREQRDSYEKIPFD